MWYRRENGVLVGGPYNCPQSFPVESLDESVAELVAFHAPKPPMDISNVDNLEKSLKALALCIAQVGGLTVPQIKTMFKQKWDALP